MRLKTAVVKTYPVPIAGFPSLASPHRVFAADPAQEGRQDALLLERCREPASGWRARGAAPRPVSGRNQPVAGRGVAEVDRGFRRNGRTFADTGAVSRGLRHRSHSRHRGRAASPVGYAAAPAAAMGRVLADGPVVE